MSEITVTPRAGLVRSSSMRAAIAAFALIFAACGDDGTGHLADAPTVQLLVEPPDVMVTIVNGQPVTQAYTATLVAPDGKKQDVTASTTFQIDSAYGQFSGDTVKVSGQGAGPTKVYAIANNVTGEATLYVYVKQAIIDPGAPPGAEALFDAATENAALAPTIAYPLDHILVPPNLGQFDVHWQNSASGSANNLFKVSMSNQYVDVRVYTTGLDAQSPQPFWTLFQPLVWYPIASSREQLDLVVSGLNTAAPGMKGTAVAQKVDVTNENAQGGIYYWTTSAPTGIWRYDVAKPTQPPEPYFPDNARPSTCMGCHALSRDGTKIAMTLDGAYGRGAVFNVADRAPINDFNGQTPLAWDFAAFDSKATKLVTVEQGVMHLRDLTGAALLAAPLPNLGSAYATHPEVSPDDTHLVNVEYSSGADYTAEGGTIVTRTFDTNTNTFGTPTVLVPYASGADNFYPSYSPDGQWIVFTRVAGNSYNNTSAQTWVVKADGSQPPVQLAIANVGGGLTNSWARWVPFAQTFGPQNEPMFYLTFSTQRPFGVRIPGGGRPQIWMTPFFPARAAAGQDPSGPAFRVPFQQVDTANHIAQWTQAVIVQ